MNEPLFAEPGASWWWLAAGPVSAAVMLAIQVSAGYGLQPLVPGLFLVMVTGFLAVQVKAARIHTSVELTREHLRQGTETIPVADVVALLPQPPGRELAGWQSARALGELTGVPRGRTGIGVRLSGARTAQAWARRSDDLRSVLGALVEDRVR